MCVICYKPSGVNFPSKTKIKTMFRANPDGAGFMYADGKNVYIQKGFMTIGDFNTALNKIRQRTDYPVVMHFRITTHGSTSTGMTHPFPLSDSIDALTATKYKTHTGIAHNGIIPITNYAKGISDTAEFIRRYGVKLLANGCDADILEVIEEVISSKLCILEANKEVHLLGDFEQDGNGVYYSNGSYKKQKKQTATTYKWKGSDSYINPTYWTTGARTTYFNCDCDCDLCCDEYDCIGAWSASNPYAPENYNTPIAYNVQGGGSL